MGFIAYGALIRILQEFCMCQTCNVLSYTMLNRGAFVHKPYKDKILFMREACEMNTKLQTAFIPPSVCPHVSYPKITETCKEDSVSMCYKPMCTYVSI